MKKVTAIVKRAKFQQIFLSFFKFAVHKFQPFFLMNALQDHRKEPFPCLWSDYHIQNGKLTATDQLLLILSNSLGKTPTG